jgi:HlyD family secretion protein
MKKRTIIIVTVALVAVAGAVLAVRARGPKPEEVQTAVASRQTVVQTVTATGKVQPKTQVKISADVSARIIRLGVKEGDRVRKGQFLVELDREHYLAAVENAQASVRSAEAQAKLARESMEQANRELKRAREVVDRKLDSVAKLDSADATYKIETARYESALGMLAQARAALKQAQDGLSKTTIYAPMEGVITELRRKQGEIAIGSQFQEDVILVLSDLSQMEVQLDVDENDIVLVALGDKATIKVDALGGGEQSGTVYEISNSARSSDAAKATGGGNGGTQKTEFLVKVAISDPRPELRPGMTASARITTETKQAALSVPIQCVTVRTLEQLKGAKEKRPRDVSGFKPDKDGFVQVLFVLDDGKAVARQVTTGIQSDNLIEVTGGLKEGETVISGTYRAISRDLEHGSKVKVNNNPKKAEKARHERAPPERGRRRRVADPGDRRPRQDLRARQHRGARASWRVAQHQAERVRRDHGAVGLRQVDADEHDRLPRHADVRVLPARRAARQPDVRGRARGHTQPPDRLRLPDFQPAAPCDRAAERRVAAGVPRPAASRAPPPRRGGDCARRPRRARPPQAERAVGRSAPACGHCARPGGRALDHPGGRAHRQPRQPHRRGHHADVRRAARSGPDHHRGHPRGGHCGPCQTHDPPA